MRCLSEREISGRRTPQADGAIRGADWQRASGGSPDLPRCVPAVLPGSRRRTLCACRSTQVQAASVFYGSSKRAGSSALRCPLTISLPCGLTTYSLPCCRQGPRESDANDPRRTQPQLTSLSAAVSCRRAAMDVSEPLDAAGIDAASVAVLQALRVSAVLKQARLQATPVPSCPLLELVSSADRPCYACPLCSLLPQLDGVFI